MTDRRRRAALRLPHSGARLGTFTDAGGRGSQSLLRERQSSSTPPEPPQGDDNPFAPPPEGKPDQPWKPRRPAAGDDPDPDPDLDSDSSSSSSSGTGSGSGSGGSSAPEDRPRSVWGSKWSSRQPGQQGGGFGGPRGRQGGPEGQGGPDNKGTGLRWDPTDPAQRRARYALLSGMWAFFCALFDLPEIALLLGALALYWGISALRGVKPADRPDATADPTTPRPAPVAASGPPAAGAGGAGPGSKPLTTAAVSGLVTATLALAIVAATFTVQIVYRDYYTCVQDSLTQSAQVTCNDLLPKTLRPVFGVKE
ncbi:hypothetical protein ABCR94_25140 [Streptomyces sp. 21So2-11]|uniref:hypothetical protein n=1 Tax=Streptomyces sp. 21So2-11 TaxID=3144408 RepID=UPI00321A1379